MEPKQSEQPSIKIEIDWSDEPPTVYANGAQVVHSSQEFSITFTEFAAIEGRRATAPGAPPKARVVSSVRLHPEVFLQFALACASNWNKFANTVAQPGAELPKFQLIQGSEAEKP